MDTGRFHCIEILASIYCFFNGSKLYQLCCIQFGIKTADSAFICASSLALGNQFDQILTMYIDDLLFTTPGNVYHQAMFSHQKYFKTAKFKSTTTNFGIFNYSRLLQKNHPIKGIAIKKKPRKRADSSSKKRDLVFIRVQKQSN